MGDMSDPDMYILCEFKFECVCKCSAYATSISKFRMSLEPLLHSLGCRWYIMQVHARLQNSCIDFTALS